MLGEKSTNIRRNAGVLEGEFLVGKTVTEVRVLTDKELDVYGWDELPQGENAFAFIFDDGTVIIPVDASRMMPGCVDYARVEFND
jgi:hypothetical protein